MWLLSLGFHLPLIKFSTTTHRFLTFRFASTALAHFNNSPAFSEPEDSSSSSLTDNNDDTVLDTFHVVQTLNHLHKHPALALSFFIQVKERGFPHNISTYAAIIRILCYWGLDRRLESARLDRLITRKSLYLGLVQFSVVQLLLDDFRDGVENGPWWQPIFNGYTTTLMVLNFGLGQLVCVFPS